MQRVTRISGEQGCDYCGYLVDVKYRIEGFFGQADLCQDCFEALKDEE